MRVVHFNKSLYTLQDLVTDKLKNFHLTQLKEFKFDPMDTDPTEVARAEQHEFLVENILEHRGDSTRRTQLEFLVQWSGYDESYNSWEPWEYVRDNEKLLVYLYRNKLRNFLTKEQKLEVEQLLLAGAQPQN